jgi:periplasmic divalent cation tolerance protein
MSAVCLGYTTFPDEKTAEMVCQKLLEEKLIACANIMPKGFSLYEWEGRLKKAFEVIAFIKTTKSCISKVTEALKNYHPHMCPCFLTMSVQDGSPEFLEWVGSSVKVS